MSRCLPRRSIPLPPARLLPPAPSEVPLEARPVVPLSERFQGMPAAALQSVPPSVGFAVQYVEARPAARAPVTKILRHTGGTPMKRYAVAILLACVLGACVQPSAPPSQQAVPPPEAAPPPPRVTSEAQIAPGRWVVDRVRCSDLLGAADEDREAAVMFYYGYLAAKAGIRVIDVNQIDGNVRKVMDRCAAAPNITVPKAFRQALGRRR